MAVIRWSDPFRELSTLQERMNRAFQDSLSRASTPREEELYTGSWAPPVDIFETKDKLVLKAELPGFKQEEIALRVENALLSIEGERKFEKESGDENYHRVERSYGKFVRTFSLPTTVDYEKIAASFENGILTVSLPKKEETKPKQIRIQVGGPAHIDVPKA